MALVAATFRDLLAAVLVVAAGAKASDVRGFGRTLAGLGLWRVSTPGRNAIAVTLIGVEAGLGLLTVAQVAVPAVNLANLVLTTLFALVVGVALWRGVAVHCRCFGALSGTSFSWRGLMRGLLLVAIGAGAVALGSAGLGPSSESSLAVAAFVMVGIAAAQASSVLASIHQEAI